MHATSNVVDIQANSAFVMRKGLSDRLQYLSAEYPQVGFGVSLETKHGDHYMLANPKMALPANKADGFPKGEQVAKLEGGERFQTIQVFADIPDGYIGQAAHEMQLILDVIDLVELIDTPSNLPAGQLQTEPGLRNVLNGTEG